MSKENIELINEWENKKRIISELNTKFIDLINSNCPEPEDSYTPYETLRENIIQKTEGKAISANNMRVEDPRENYLAWHILIGSTISQAEVPIIDFEGDANIENNLKRYIKIIEDNKERLKTIKNNEEFIKFILKPEEMF